MTSDNIQQEIQPAHLRAARAILGVSQAVVAGWASVSTRTVSQFELGSSANRGTRRLLATALSAQGVAWGEEGGRVWVAGPPPAIEPALDAEAAEGG